MAWSLALTDGKVGVVKLIIFITYYTFIRVVFVLVVPLGAVAEGVSLAML